MRPGFLFCHDPLRPARPDPEFAAEVTAVRAAGAPLALIGHEALTGGDPRGAVARVPRDSGRYWYRGWMLPAVEYGELARALRERGCALMTPPGAYVRAHELPGWYAVFAELTPRSAWCPASPGTPPGTAALTELAGQLAPGAGIVKDHVKSRKHEWDEACFVPDLRDPVRLSAVVRRFFALQDEALAGGLVVREFEPFVPGGEARVWWLDGEPVLVTAHPDTPAERPQPELTAVRAAVAALDCRFVTTDLALRSDGRGWRVVEVGDGQVSGLPRGSGGAAQAPSPGVPAGDNGSGHDPADVLVRALYGAPAAVRWGR
ncbi:ATP-grasp domain-containing protein [Streptomyces uncialis]|uniref:ATP-grasp domain-containing protein n=1 Tax=Streptomyces uncialis TaxID=1048205 RepID=UPI003657ADCD